MVRLHAPLSGRLPVHRHHHRSEASHRRPPRREGKPLHPVAPSGSARLPRAPRHAGGCAKARGGNQAIEPHRQAPARTEVGGRVKLRPWDWAGVGVALACAALFVRLGVWQVHRLQQRRARNASIAARRALPPIVLGATAGAGGGELAPDSVQDRRVTARGTYDYSAERLWAGRTYEGTPGVAVLSPLRPAGGGAGFEVRKTPGWNPSAGSPTMTPSSLKK